MNKKVAALTVIVCVAVVSTAMIYFVKFRQPSQAAQGGDEFSSVDDLLKDLEDFLNFENQTFDYNLGEISGGWG